ncbi:alpha/beta hydrolase [Natronorubrum sulfidifaciens]|uniref:Phospholipase/carboxylesterase n=1 Tax=Natronorubrum sulfidifaciens JCM 14089 TaxID=1230460 RepID=L9WBG6_9EURY|nr:dienelactone hydrolase family protein [Natronorubrum sulfidifaciens]ELY46702.1 phospholipase/carboxylesterase [Natronorubrum sulfidifaciens JCM 14089]
MSAGDDVDGPHQGQPLVTAGTPLEDASAAIVLTHGRGATAQGMLDLANEIHHDGVALLAPQAAGKTWYPNSFLAPVEANEPGRTSGLQAIADAIDEVSDAGISTDRVMLVGFSQGACLASEFLARNPRRYGGLAALSGGLIGEDLDDEYPGNLEDTPVFLGCSDVDPHIPEERVHETADAFESMHADVSKRLYEGMGHGVNEDELEFVSGMVAALLED